MGFDFSIDAILAPTSTSYEEEEVDIEGFDGEEADEQMARNSVQSDDGASDGDSSSSSSTRPSSSIGSPDQNSSLERPIFTYPSLIYLAIINSPNKMLLLSEICEWIRQNFQYYREKNSDFTNSIRHNLSVKDIFQRSRRYLNDPGRGDYWTIDPNCVDISIGENTGRLRYTKIGDPKRSNTTKSVHQSPQMYPFCITRHVMPTAIYFPTPGEQMQIVHNQEAIMHHQHLNSTMQSWNNHEPSCPDCIQSIYSQPRHTQNG